MVWDSGPGAGNNTFRGTASGETADGLAGADTLYGGAGDDTLSGSAGNDLLLGDGNVGDSLESTDDILYGGTGNDTLYGGRENDSMFGGSGDDVIGTFQTTNLNFTDPNATEGDKIGNVVGPISNRYVYNGSDTDFTGTVRFELTTVPGHTYNITFDSGKNGNNTGTMRIQTQVNGETLGVRVAETTGTTIYRFTATSTTTQIDFNDVSTGTSVSEDLWLGNVSVTTESEEAGDDYIEAGDGNDQVWSGSQADTVYGGAGIDTLYAGTGNDFVEGDADNDSIFGQGGDDTLYGGSGADIIDGGRQNDTIDGGEGLDTLFGKSGEDVITVAAFNGGDAEDTLYGGAGNDTLTGNNVSQFIFGDSGDDIISGDSDVDGFGGIETDTNSSETDFLYGGGGNDTIYSGYQGTTGTFGDSIDGGAGNDLIYGGTANDTIDGGVGADTLFGRAGDDVITVSGGDDARGNRDADTFIIAADDLTAGDTITINGGSTGNDNDAIQLGAGLNFVRYENLTAENNGNAGQDGDLVVNDGTNDYTIFFRDIEDVTAVCFTAGTMIATPEGERAIEDLAKGDMVLTMDDGAQPIRWIGERVFGKPALEANPKLLPIRIQAGSLGVGMPAQDLLVSRQHRILVRSKIALRMFGSEEILVAANKLLAIDGIDIAWDVEEVRYWHFLFDRHQIVWSNGAATESLFTGPQALKAVSPEAREEIMTIFPEICEPGFTPEPARLIPEKGKKVKNFSLRHQQKGKTLVDRGRSAPCPHL